MVDRAQRISPFADISLPSGLDAFTMRDAGPAVRFVFRGTHGAAAIISSAFGLALPLMPCRATIAGARHALWLGPDEWFLVAQDTEADQLARALRQALGTEPHSLVDVSHRGVGLILEGARVTEVLSTGCPLDLEVDAFPVGACTRSVFGKAEIVLWRTAPHAFHLEVWRSFLPYVVGLLEIGAR
jgi:sarcosine oxidase subunit gamma